MNETNRITSRIEWVSESVSRGVNQSSHIRADYIDVCDVRTLQVVYDPNFAQK